MSTLIPIHITSFLAITVATLFLLVYRWSIQHTGTKPLKTGPAPNNRHIFRVLGIPTDWDVGRLTELLADSQKATPNIKSLSADIGDTFKIATVSFESHLPTPIHKQNRIALPSSFDGQLANIRSIQLDSTFHGITCLYTPQPEDHKVE